MNILTSVSKTRFTKQMHCTNKQNKYILITREPQNKIFDFLNVTDINFNETHRKYLLGLVLILQTRKHCKLEKYKIPLYVF
jgi:hypothetical protein